MKLYKTIPAAIIGGTAIFAGASFMAHKALLDREFDTPQALKDVFYKRSKKPTLREADEREIWFNNQDFKEYVIENAAGKKIKGYFLPSDTPSDIYVLCCPGYKAGAKKEFRFISKFYHDAGINLFLIDHQAAGESEGKYISFGVKEYPDALQWLHFINTTFGSDIKIILHGVSMGAATVNLMCGDASLPDNVIFAVSDCSFTSPYELFKHSLKNAHWPVYPLLTGIDITNRLTQGFSFEDCPTPIEAVKYSHTPTLFIHGKRDNFVPWHMSEELYKSSSAEDKELYMIDNASHCACYLKEPEEYTKRILSFIEKYGRP